METINTPVSPPSTAEVDFTSSPTGGLYEYVVGGTTIVTDTYVTPINQPITFSATSTFPSGRYAVEYHWDFSDGDEGYGGEVDHTFTVPNDYHRVTLTVTDNFGTTTQVGHQIYLRDLGLFVVNPVIVLV